MQFYHTARKKSRFDNEINFNRETINPSTLDIGDYKDFIHEEIKTKENFLMILNPLLQK